MAKTANSRNSRLTAVLLAVLLSALAFASPASANDPVECWSSDATIIGTEGDDVLIGTSERDVIAGLGGNDTIISGAGSDIICGGAGDDYIENYDNISYIFADDGNDTIVGGANLIHAGDGDDSVTVTRRGVEAWTGPGNDTVVLTVKSRVHTEAGDDIITGSPASDYIEAGGGDDVVRAGAGIDVVYGDYVHTPRGAKPGNDVLRGGADRDHLYGNQGDDKLIGGDGNDVLDGGIGADVLIGGKGNDTMNFEYSRDNKIAKGGAGDDSMANGTSGQEHTTTLRGGPGKDTFHLRRGTTHAFGNGGADTFDLDDGSFGVVRAGEGADVVMYDNASNLRIELGPGNDSLYPVRQLNDDRHLPIQANGGRGSDVLLGNEGNDELDGGPGHDFIEGWRGDDIIIGDDGDDELHGGWGADRVVGGEGNDLCHAGRFAMTSGGRQLTIGSPDTGDSTARCVNERALPIGTFTIGWSEAAPDFLIDFYDYRQEHVDDQFLEAETSELRSDADIASPFDNQSRYLSLS